MDYRIGDCLELMNQMDEETVEVVVTSPPYNIGIPYGKYEDKKDGEDYLDWLGDICRAIYRVTKPDSHFFLQFGGTSKDPLKPFEALTRALEAGWVMQNQILWVKSISIGEETRGHFKPVNSPRYLNNLYEFIFHLTKDGAQIIDRLSLGVPYMDKTNIERLSGTKKDLRCRGNIWFSPYETVASAKLHPAAFPIEIPRNCIRLSGKKGLVLDPFAGSGTTLIAAEELGNPSIGFDLDESYQEVFRNRVIGKKEDAYEHSTRIGYHRPSLWRAPEPTRPGSELDPH